MLNPTIVAFHFNDIRELNIKEKQYNLEICFLNERSPDKEKKLIYIASVDLYRLSIIRKL